MLNIFAVRSCVRRSEFGVSQRRESPHSSSQPAVTNYNLRVTRTYVQVIVVEVVVIAALWALGRAFS